MDTYALGYRERSLRTSSIGVKHLHYHTKRTPSPPTLPPTTPTVETPLSDVSPVEKDASPKETIQGDKPKENHDTQGKDHVEGVPKGDATNENTQEPNKE